jgi:hypothetical protein
MTGVSPQDERNGPSTDWPPAPTHEHLIRSPGGFRPVIPPSEEIDLMGTTAEGTVPPNDYWS